MRCDNTLDPLKTTLCRCLACCGAENKRRSINDRVDFLLGDPSEPWKVQVQVDW